jgi:hypothetical protein
VVASNPIKELEFTIGPHLLLFSYFPLHFCFHVVLRVVAIIIVAIALFRIVVTLCNVVIIVLSFHVIKACIAHLHIL